jgi:hypothetical protein
MGFRARASLAFATCVTVAGCSLVVSLDDLGGPDASLADVTNDSDSNVPDVADASTEATPLACPTPDAGTAFCDDFDDSDASAFTHWSSTFTTNMAKVARVDSDASSPFAARFTTSPNPDGGSPQSELKRVFLNPPVSRITFSFTVRVGQLGGGIHIAPVTLKNGDPLSSVDYLSITTTSTSFNEQVYTDAGTSVYPTHPLTDTVATGQWIRVKIEYTLGADGGGAMAQVSYNGSPVTSPFAIDARSVIGTIQMAAGISSVTSYIDAGSSVDFDDVVMTVE